MPRHGVLPRMRALLVAALACALTATGCLRGDDPAATGEPCVRVEVEAAPVVTVGENATVTLRVQNCGGAPVALAGGECPGAGPLQAVVSWNGTRWVLADAGSALDPALRACPGGDGAPHVLEPNAQLTLARAWNGTVLAQPCGADVSPCEGAGWRALPPGPHVVEGLVYAAEGAASWRGQATLTLRAAGA